MRHDGIIMTPVYVRFSSCCCHLSKSTQKMFRFLKPEARLGWYNSMRFLVHRSVFTKKHALLCKLKRQIGCSKRQETMYWKQLNWTGKQFGLSEEFKFSRRMIIPFSSICLSAICNMCICNFCDSNQNPRKNEPGHPSGAPSKASTYLSSVLGSWKR